MKSVKSTCLALALVAPIANCAASLAEPERFSSQKTPPTSDASSDGDAAAACPDVVTTVFSSSACASAGCHASSMPAGNLDLTSPDLGKHLAGRKASTGALLVDPSSPEDSVLYLRLLPNASPTVMPPNGSLDDATIACVGLWIGSLDHDIPLDAGDMPDSSPGMTTVRVAAGRTTPYTDPNGNVWSADNGFVGGAGGMQATPLEIANTTMSPLYNSERYGGTETTPEAFSYVFPVTAGNYRVTLKFAETYRNGPNERKFNVAINGQRVLTDFDVVAAAGGKLIAVDREFTTNATSDGQIRIEFAPGTVFNPMVNALQIVPSP